jgi:hypothetical protein
MYTTVLDGEPDWAPLERLAGELGARGRRLRPEDYLYRGREVAAGCPDIHLYEARDTRRLLNLDDTGCAYRYLAPLVDGADDAEYVAVADVDAAVRWARWRPTDHASVSGLYESGRRSR